MYHGREGGRTGALKCETAAGRGRGRRRRRCGGSGRPEKRGGTEGVARERGCFRGEQDCRERPTGRRPRLRRSRSSRHQRGHQYAAFAVETLLPSLDAQVLRERRRRAGGRPEGPVAKPEPEQGHAQVLLGACCCFNRGFVRSMSHSLPWQSRSVELLLDGFDPLLFQGGAIGTLRRSSFIILLISLLFCMTLLFPRDANPFEGRIFKTIGLHTCLPFSRFCP